ncbi:hypothetical protein A5906_26505 [Bradyrhizobium sacchari]|uniref:Uncharacterized protein n=1 Tax=Bradyrhizobium sacchari TaxID=1399419 RepID=A0A560JYI7_9BRAD|nr:hypothetical protein [Bradyrhizobium sacchari]OPY99275.1 hypothetical protein A5906_26505 [Bradyrhizobium sacchari]TWB62907.1 hypothetical protein FBZ94_103606 [Bradyrhizobium sacchari]TWB76163.1 hypothetical protein FBZ95_104344 [Bradyrhizobium sacchari]
MTTLGLSCGIAGGYRVSARAAAAELAGRTRLAPFAARARTLHYFDVKPSGNDAGENGRFPITPRPAISSSPSISTSAAVSSDGGFLPAAFGFLPGNSVTASGTVGAIPAVTSIAARPSGLATVVNDKSAGASNAAYDIEGNATGITPISAALAHLPVLAILSRATW